MEDQPSLIARTARRFQVVRNRFGRRRAAGTVAWPIVEVNESDPCARTDDAVAPVHLETDGPGGRGRHSTEGCQLWRVERERGAVGGEGGEKTAGRAVELAHATLAMALPAHAPDAAGPHARQGLA